MTILATDCNKFKLPLRESLRIERDKPILNRTVKSFPLELFYHDDSFIFNIIWLSGFVLNIIGILFLIKQCSLKFLFGNKWWSTKVAAKLLFGVVTFSIFYSDIPLGFHESIRVVPLKYLIYFLADINTKYLWTFSWRKIFCSIKNTKFIYQIFC